MSVFGRSLVYSALIICIGAFSFCSRNRHASGRILFTLTDDLGRTVEFPSVPRRIISLAPNITEAVFALHCDSVLVGVTKYCDYPEAAKRKTSIGDILTPSLEAIVSLKPDLVIISVEGNTRQTFDRLNELGVRQFVSNPRSLEGVLKTLTDLGVLLHEVDRTRQFVDSLKGMMHAVEAGSIAGRKPKLLMLLSLQPIIAVGANTCLHDIILRSGAENLGAGASGNYPTLNREAVLSYNPDIILLPNDLNVSTDFLLGAFPEWKALSAVRSGQIHIVDANILLRPGPRIFQGLQLVERIVRGYAENR